MRFQQVQNQRPWITERPLRTPFHNICVFEAHHENLNKDRPTLSPAKV